MEWVAMLHCIRKHWSHIKCRIDGKTLAEYREVLIKELELASRKTNRSLQRIQETPERDTQPGLGADRTEASQQNSDEGNR